MTLLYYWFFLAFYLIAGPLYPSMQSRTVKPLVQLPNPLVVEPGPRETPNGW